MQPELITHSVHIGVIDQILCGRITKSTIVNPLDELLKKCNIVLLDPKRVGGGDRPCRGESYSTPNECRGQKEIWVGSYFVIVYFFLYQALCMSRIQCGTNYFCAPMCI